MTTDALVSDIRNRWKDATAVAPGTQIHLWADGSADLFVGKPTSESGFSLTWADLPAPWVTFVSSAAHDVEVLLAVIERQSRQLEHDYEVRVHQERG